MGLLAFKGRLDVPLANVTSIHVVPRGDIPYMEGTWLRHPGTHIPELIRYGSYGTAPLREFSAVLRQHRVMVINVNDWSYARLVLGLRDPESVEAALATAIEGHST